jgi:DNA gyrase subunit B
VDVLSDIALPIDTKVDLQTEDSVNQVAAKLREAKLEVTLARDEEHSAWMIGYKDPTNATRFINPEFLSMPEFRRMRSLMKTVGKYNQAPFVLIRDTQRQTLPNWRELLSTVKSEGTREVNVQRYKGLGEMNAEQLWETTMNAEKRTLLRVELRDFAEAEPIFSTLMGEDVESRRRFIEENALDVRNLDV